MFKSLIFILGFSTALLSCVHSRDYAQTTIALTPAGQTVTLTSPEQVSGCQKIGDVIGKGEAPAVDEAVAAAIKDGQNQTGLQGANTMLYQRTRALKDWENYRVDMEFDVYTCAHAAALNFASVQKNAAAAAQISIQQQAADEAALQAHIQAAQAAQAEADAAMQAAQAASQAAAQAAMQASQVNP